MTALKELLKALLAAGVSLALAGAAVAEEQKLNRLADAPSPYLRQHATNPVDWFPWGPEALERARAEDKPILVSVGYAACHWCHVMREESFENEEIAAFLNEHFVSIKIDRERRPDLDEQFMVATELISGTGGWPNTVFLTPEGRPFFAGTYFPPDLFWRILLQVVIAWETDREAVSAEGARIAAAVSRVLDQSAPAREVSAEAVTRAAASILEDFDPFHGGFGTAPKFPREPMLLFLLDEAERNRDATVLEAVLGTLDGMIRGGIHDHVGGGFHRYAVDPEWHVPHFEKMLYTQALMGRLLTRAFRITCEPRYARAAERVFAFVLREMRAPGGAFISALDADSLSADGRRVEGAFYTWTPAELAGLGAADAELVARLFGVTEEGDVEGRNVLALTAPLEELAEELGTDEAALTARLDQLLARMAELRASRPRPLADEKVVMSWAALMSATLAEASVVFARDDWLRAAEEAAVFLLEEMWLGGERARVHFEGEASVPAQLPDHAALGLMALALHDAAREPAARARWLAVARDIAEELSPRYGEPGEGFRLRPRSEGLGVVRPVDDAEIPSGNGLALEFLGRLSRRAALAGVERDALRLAGALSGLALELPAQRAYALMAIARLERGETGHHRFAARGAVELRFSRAPGAAQARLSLDIAPGWHINAHEPLEDYLIPTGLALDGRPVEVAYPEPVLRQLGFSATPLALYEGRVELDVPLPDGASGTLQLTIQACNDEVCLQPETLAFPLW